MDGNHLIPFGLHLETGQFVDVDDVPRGEACGCICPACKTTLVARKGDVNDPHFAHKNRKSYEGTQEYCDFSFYFSVRMMAKQLIGNECTLGLPDYKGNIPGRRNVLGWYFPNEEFTVTKHSTVTLTNVEVEKSIERIAVDAIGQLGKYQLGLYFSHPGRHVPNELKSIKNDHIGIVEINLSNLFEYFKENQKIGLNYQKSLHRFLLENLQSKSWIYHPRYKSKHEAAMANFEAKIQQSMQTVTTSAKEQSNPLVFEPGYSLQHLTTVVEQLKQSKSVIPEPEIETTYKCLHCKTVYTLNKPGFPKCPKCHTDLFAKRIYV